MRFRQSGWTKSFFILVSLGMTGAMVIDCGGDDTGSTTGTGGSAGTGGGGTGGSGTDAGTGGAGGTLDAGRDASDSSLGGGGGTGGGGTGGTNTATDARVSDVSPEAAIAACGSALTDAGVNPCLTACFCSQCAAPAAACLGSPDCFAIAQCALETLCFVDGGVPACLTPNTCGPVVALHTSGLVPARDFATNDCVPACVTQCTPPSEAGEAAASDATPSTDATPASDATDAPADGATEASEAAAD
jgi:hypothetical protein